MSIQLMTGYRRHGKDTVQKASHTHILVPLTHPVYSKLSWVGYMQPGEGVSPPVYADLERVAFADALKRFTHVKLGLDPVDAQHYDDVKDTMVVQAPDTGLETTLRGHYIEYGRQEREKDADVWCKAACHQLITAIQDKDAAEQCHVQITDWRFPNELRYTIEAAKHLGLPLSTWRVFRASVPIPDADEPSEHSLDSCPTDVLLLTSAEEFHLACERFPQYRHYVPSFKIVDRDVGDSFRRPHLLAPGLVQDWKSDVVTCGFVVKDVIYSVCDSEGIEFTWVGYTLQSFGPQEKQYRITYTSGPREHCSPFTNVKLLAISVNFPAPQNYLGDFAYISNRIMLFYPQMIGAIRVDSHTLWVAQPPVGSMFTVHRETSNIQWLGLNSLDELAQARYFLATVLDWSHLLTNPEQYTSAKPDGDSMQLQNFHTVELHENFKQLKLQQSG